MARVYNNEDSDDDSSDMMGDDNIRISGNRIYFSADIDKSTALDFNMKLDQVVSRTLRDAFMARQNPPPIHVYIHSHGGCVHSGLSMMDHIANCPVEVYTYGDGLVASAATLMLLAGSKKYMYSSTRVLIHSISTTFWGKFEDLKDEVSNIDDLMKTLKKVYTTYAKIPEDKLERLLTRELYLSGEQCVEYGIVDELVDNTHIRKIKVFNE